MSDKRNYRRLLKPLALLAMAALLSLGLELMLQRTPFQIPAEQKGDIVLSLDECIVTGGEQEAAEEATEEATGDVWEELPEEELPEEEAAPERENLDDLFFSGWLPTALADETVNPGSSVELSGDMTLTLPWSGYVKELTVEAECALSGHWLLQVDYADGSHEDRALMFNASLDEDTAVIGREVSSITISFPEMSARIKGITIHNGFAPNWIRMLLVFLGVICFGCLFLYRREMGKKPEYAFLCVALCVGIFLCYGLPMTTSLSYDDEIHAEDVDLLSRLGSGTMDLSWNSLTTMSWPASTGIDAMVLGIDSCRDNQALIRKMDEAGRTARQDVERVWNWKYADVGYVTQAIGVAAARLVGLPVHSQLIAARLCNMLTYVLLCFLAIRLLKRFRYVTLCVALMPAPMFLACNLSYDPTGIALCWLGTAMAVDAFLDRKTRLTPGRGMGILLCLLLGSLTKMVYMPLMLLVLLLPRSKFDSKRSATLYKTLAMGLMLAAIVSEVLLVNGGSVALEDDRAMVSDSGSQLDFILSQPFTYLGYFFSCLWSGFGTWFVGLIRTNWGYVGSLAEPWSWFSLGLLLFAAFTDHSAEADRRLNWKQRSFMLLTAGICIGMVFTVMYIAYSAVGAADFSGVQPRYLLPVYLLLMMLLSPDGIENRLKPRQYTLVLAVGNALILGFMCLQMVLLNYYL